jgi:hypothetical protein
MKRHFFYLIFVFSACVSLTVFSYSTSGAKINSFCSDCSVNTSCENRNKFVAPEFANWKEVDYENGRLKAIKGDGVTAIDVGIYNGKLYGSLPESDGEKSVYFWFRIGAENGDPIAQQNYASYLLDRINDDDEFSCQRAAYWINESRRCFGASSEISLLQETLSVKCSKE